MMPASIIVPSLDPNYDLVVLSPLQIALVPYEGWWSLFLWTMFAFLLFYQIYKNLLAPYLK